MLTYRGARSFLATLSLLALTLAGPRPASASAPAAPSDFDGDGYADLAIGVPDEHGSPGIVQVMYGSSSGLTPAGDQLWSPAALGIPDTPVPVASFGDRIASADFNADGHADLAVGAFGEYFPDFTTAHGAVHVIFGTAAGLRATGSQLIAPTAIPGLPQGLWAWDFATGRFDDDGYPDLAVIGEGGLVILQGGVAGLQPSQVIPIDHSQNVATGDLDGDGIDEVLLVTDGVDTANGHLEVLAGTPDGVSPSVTTDIDATTPGLVGGESSLGFGQLATGDFNGDGRDDVAVSSGTAHGGGAHILFGSATGLTIAGGQFWTQDTPGVPGRGEAEDSFGYQMAVGDFEGNGVDDLVLTNAVEGIGDRHRAGAVTVLRGVKGVGLSAAGSTLWTQDSTGVPDITQKNDLFGSAVATGNFGYSYRDDLAIGVMGEDTNGAHNSGMVNVLYGSRSGITGTNSQRWWQDSPGIKETAEDSDLFGEFLSH